MMRAENWLRVGISALLVFSQSFVYVAKAQISGMPTATCHVTDGTFTACPNGPSEWSDVQPVSFPSTNSFLYVNQDAGHNYLYLMYDFPFRTTRIAATDSVHVSFDTVSRDSGSPALEEYDVLIFGDGSVQVLEQGKPTPAGRISGAVGFGASPNSNVQHLMAELQVPLTPGPPTLYSSDPLFWSASVPPTPPPNPCPTDPGKTYDRCTKAYLNNAQANAAEISLTLLTAGGVCSSYAALACAPLEPGLLALGFVWGVAAIEFGRKLGADPPGVDFSVPPDPNYTVIAQPATYTLTLPTAGLTAQETAAINAFAINAQQLIALEQATTTALARAEGANAAKNTLWVANQMQAARQFGTQAGGLISQLPSLLANLNTAITVAGTQFTFKANDIETFLSQINPTSPQTEPQQEFATVAQMVSKQLGLTSADQTLLLAMLTATDPQAAATLGTGAFPQALSDPVIATTLQQVSSGLIQDAPSPKALVPSFQITLPGDYVAAGVGLRGNTSGSIKISNIPAGATVERAFLYWGMLDDGLEPSLAQLSLNGTPLTGSLLDSGPDTCWSRTFSFSFRAEVSQLVTGNGSYSLTGVASGGNVLAEGASLVVIYSLPSAPVKNMMIMDGNVSIPNGVTSSVANFTGFVATSPVSAKTTFVVGDGQGTIVQTPVSFTGSAGSISFPNLFDALDGPLWDTNTFDVSSKVGASPSASSASTTITYSGDCLLWTAQLFSVTSTLVGEPVTATAAVVQANTSGDTIANTRGLTPSAAPTIQDQIQMVVQSETIQNPSISGPDLTSQLVTGLVNDGIITTTQANIIQTAVVQNLVQPVGEPSISGTALSVSVMPSSNSELDLKLADIGAGNAVTTIITGISVKTLSGTGSVTVNSPSLPVTIGNIAVGASAPTKIFLNVPNTVKRFTITENGTVQDTLGKTLNFSTSQQIFVQ